MSEKIRKKYYCENCDYTTGDKKDWNKHIMTRKHKNSGQMITLSEKKSEDDKKLLEPIKQTVYQVKKYEYVCNLCNKKYKYNSGLSRHIKKCHSEDNTPYYYSTENFSEAEKSLLEKQQKQIENLQKLLQNTLEQNKNTMDSLIPKLGNNTFNTTNNKMTINVFLNEQCKDAINLTDFLNQLELSLEDLVYTNKNGYEKGISNIFVKRLTDLKPTERPIHCTDRKRLQFYVKDEDKWEKDVEHEKLEKSIQTITKKQIKQIKEWEQSHPNWNNDDKETEMYMTMIKQVMGSNDNEQLENIKRELGYSIDLKEFIESS